ncbi:heterokaryon incompatibility protein 6,OR allele [Cladorrhinum samala]|uniref:Heterokaryon incompatibility protein 6,OR allele n=1 Tax=Cladorrhinum samala TaxID=585594 RepID=A0AAV9HW65_9PEZI|nr:heterokaryon incompatibility protein 6,OR allele [Cladorrhinum samala]
MTDVPPLLPPRSGHRYTALAASTIRILRIFDGTGLEDPLTCGLETFHLNQLPPYEALSYCWGDQKEKHEIILDGSKFEVATNLHSALLRLRLHDKPRLLWVDALCINQNDIPERNSQVSLMRDIYRQAECVLIWLGGPVMVDDKELWAIPHLLEAQEKNLKRTDLPIRHGTKDWVKYVMSSDWATNGDLGDRRWNAIIRGLVSLLQRPWFLRTWIIQEAALAKHSVVVCGSHYVDWEPFCRAVGYAIDLDYFASTSPEIYSALRNIERARRRLAVGQFQRPLDLLAGFRIFQATDPRDKLFGVLGLLDPADLKVLQLKRADYDMEVRDVYTQAAIDCMALEGNLDVLSLGGKFSRSADGSTRTLPSWVPDWTFHQERVKPLHPRFLSTLSFGNYQQMAPQSAACDSRASFSVSADRSVLTLSGYVYDSIAAVSDVLARDYYDPQEGHPLTPARDKEYEWSGFDPEVEEAVRVLAQWESLCGVPASAPYPFTSQQPAQEVFFQTVHANCYPSGSVSQTRARFELWYKPFLELRSITAAIGEIDGFAGNESMSDWQKIGAGTKWMGKVVYKTAKFGFKYALATRPSRVQHNATMVGLGRVMFKTGKGYVGLTERNVKAGDKVALVKGGRMPIVVREAVNDGGDGDDQSEWEILGDAYVHGIMGGEGWDEARCVEMRIV